MSFMLDAMLVAARAALSLRPISLRENSLALIDKLRAENAGDRFAGVIPRPALL
jgi:hypothetical protein